MKKVQKGELPDFNLSFEGILRYGNRVIVLKDEILKNEILEKTHRSKYMIHLGSSKIYQDLRGLY